MYTVTYEKSEFHRESEESGYSRMEMESQCTISVFKIKVENRFQFLSQLWPHGT